ncbi:MAG TPA: L-threonylcarbamoyladenylate synthase [Candidatus Eisenbacteria bacterium]|nr:L-threonylcarbamoyladenylate synthase [Candidatus Eisenbacteria bacterium]
MEPVRLRLGELPDEEIARRAADVLLRGGVALLPAEGVYGFHVSAASPAAVKRILELKGRSDRVGFIGLIADPVDAARWARVDAKVEGLMLRYWPGALTIVLEALPEAPAVLCSERGTIALRCPGVPFLRSTARRTGGPLLSTSANAPGHPSAIRLEDAPSGVAELAVDGGALSGTPSTLVRISGGEVEILRPGAVRLED